MVAADRNRCINCTLTIVHLLVLASKQAISHSYDILGARMLWKPKETRILTNFINQPE
jgi:hypothetical protein